VGAVGGVGVGRLGEDALVEAVHLAPGVPVFLAGGGADPEDDAGAVDGEALLADQEVGGGELGAADAVALGEGGAGGAGGAGVPVPGAAVAVAGEVPAVEGGEGFGHALGVAQDLLDGEAAEGGHGEVFGGLGHVEPGVDLAEQVFLLGGEGRVVAAARLLGGDAGAQALDGGGPQGDEGDHVGVGLVDDLVGPLDLGEVAAALALEEQHGAVDVEPPERVVVLPPGVGGGHDAAGAGRRRGFGPGFRLCRHAAVLLRRRSRRAWRAEPAGVEAVGGRPGACPDAAARHARASAVQRSECPSAVRRAA